MKKLKLKTNKINVVKLIRLIIGILNLVIDTFKDDSEDLNNNGIPDTDENIASTLARFSLAGSVFSELCRDACQNPETFDKIYGETLENYVNQANEIHQNSIDNEQKTEESMA